MDVTSEQQAARERIDRDLREQAWLIWDGQFESDGSVRYRVEASQLNEQEEPGERRSFVYTIQRDGTVIPTIG